MTLIQTIARKEFIETLRDGRFRAALFITLALLLVSLLLGWKSWSEVHAQRETARRVVRAQWLAQGAKNPHSAAHYGTYAFRPTPPLSFAEPGIHPYTGVAVWLEAHKQNDFQARPARDATSVGRFGALSAAFVMQVLLPLLIVLLAFGAFATERESGTLRQVLSLGVPQTTWALGKMLGLVAALATLLLPATILGVAALTLASSATSLGESLSRMALMGLGYALYFGAFIGLCLAVSARAHSSRAALVVLLGFWMFNSLLLPRVASDLARKIYPTPSAFAFAKQLKADLKEGIDRNDPQNESLKRLEAKVLQQYSAKSIEKLPVNFAGLALQEGEEHGNHVFDRRYAQLWDAIERQNALGSAMALGAPMLAARGWSMALAGTDFAQHRRFAQDAEEHRRGIQRMMNGDVANHPLKDKDTPYLGNAATWARVPDFNPQTPRLGWVVSNQLPALGVLLLWCVAGTGAALWSATRLRVE